MNISAETQWSLLQGHTKIIVAFQMDGSACELASWRLLYEDPRLIGLFLKSLQTFCIQNGASGYLLPLLSNNQGVPNGLKQCVPLWPILSTYPVYFHLPRSYHTLEKWSYMDWNLLSSITAGFLFDCFGHTTTKHFSELYGSDQIIQVVDLLKCLDPRKVILNIDTFGIEIGLMGHEPINHWTRRRIQQFRSEWGPSDYKDYFNQEYESSYMKRLSDQHW